MTTDSTLAREASEAILDYWFADQYRRREDFPAIKQAIAAAVIERASTLQSARPGSVGSAAETTTARDIYDRLFRLGKYRTAPTPMDPLAEIEARLTLVRSIRSVHLIPWEHGQQGVAIEYADGFSTALPLSVEGGSVCAPMPRRNTDELVEDLQNEADLCRNKGATDIADLPDEAIAALSQVSGRDRLPAGHIVLEQADNLEGTVSQTVRRPDGSEYERRVDAEEAYGVEE